MDKWIDLVISWMPFLVLIVIWLWVSRSMGMRAKSSSGATLIELYEQQVVETRRMNANLERIAASLKKRESSARSLPSS